MELLKFGITQIQPMKSTAIAHVRTLSPWMLPLEHYRHAPMFQMSMISVNEQPQVEVADASVASA
jgi:hypothetical protein